jgi:hypothetical protein
MAEFDCFLTRTEFAELLESALRDSFRLCINKNLPRPEREYVQEKEDIRRLLEANQFAFILEREDFSRHPVALRPIERDGVKLWYPRAKEGGPVIEAYFFAPYLENDDRFIPCSLITYSTKFVNPTTGLEEAAGGDVKHAYDALVGPLRKAFKRVRSTKRVAYVSPRVRRLIESGWKLAKPFEAEEITS